MKKYILLFILSILLTAGCREYLDVKPEKAIVVPGKLEDLERLTNNITIMNKNYPVMGIWASDELLTTDAGWQSLYSPVLENSYIWDYSKGLEYVSEWAASYWQVFYSNVILDRLSDMASDSDLADMVKGRALFFRGHAFFNLISLFTLPYERGRANEQLGIPLKLSPKIDETVHRATLHKSYEQVLKDIMQSLEYLPEKSAYLTQPTRNAGNGLLARIYLQLGNYVKANSHARKVIDDNISLMDFNELDPMQRYPIPGSNDEVIYESSILATYIYYTPLVYIRPSLYDLYSEGDLRKTLFFEENREGYISYRGSYLGKRDGFGGISLNEMYLIVSECLIREGSIEEGLSYLNILLEKRYRTGTYVPYTGLTQKEALDRVLEERRKELVFRHNRWLDLRRLNKEKGLETTIKRTLKGQVYQLEPGSNGYVFPIPVDEIQLTGMEQNPM